MPVLLLWLLPLPLLWNPSKLAAQPPADSARGASIFASQCAICHGQRGEGGRGAALARARLRHAPDDEALRRIIRRGLPGTGMPATWLNEAELNDIAAYVRSLGRGVQPAPAAGDAARGKTIYESPAAACAGCHTIQGRGGAFGPDLTGIGARRSALHLRASILDPAADVPPDFVLVRATTLRGAVISGARVNQDTFSVQIRDASGQLQSLWRSELRTLSAELGKTAMPSYRDKFAARDLDDLVAYLASLGEPAQ